MFKWINLLILVSLLFSSCSMISNRYILDSETDITRKISLDGKWKFRQGELYPMNFYLSDFNDSEWEEINVPSNWYLQGKDFSGKALYRKKFTPDTRLKNKYIKLNFKGVDYTSDIWLNSQYIGFHEGYFKDFSFDISDKLIFGKENVLAILVNSPYEEIGKNWSLNKRLIKGIFNHHDTRPGGAWSIKGQDKNTGGIWGNVSLEISDLISFYEVKITNSLTKEFGNANSEVEVNLDSKIDGNIELSLKIEPYNFFPEKDIKNTHKISVNLKKGYNKLLFKMINNETHFWWPWEFGKPNLYKLDINAFYENKLIDQKEEIFGFRKIEVDSNKLFSINNKKLFLRGTNYISTQWLTEMTRDKYLQDILLMKKANINTVRVHAHIEADEFYKLCDEQGLMIWQDFPLQWGYIDNKNFIDEALRQEDEMVDLLYNSPSVIAWSLHNEPPWDASWMKYKYPDYNPEQNKLLDEELLSNIKKRDNSRFIQGYSSTLSHPWYGWYSGTAKDYRKQSKEPVVEEFGTQALPNIQTLRKIFPEESLFPKLKKDWELWGYHNFQRDETFKNAKVEQGKNINEFIENTQNYQSKLIKIAVESLRMQKDNPVTGIFQFMFVENWPSVNWGIVDFTRTEKKGYETLRSVYQPVFPCIFSENEIFKENEPFSIEIWAINDLINKFDNASLSYIIKNETGIIERNVINLDLEESISKKITMISFNNLKAGNYEVIAEIKDINSNILGQNSFNFIINK